MTAKFTRFHTYTHDRMLDAAILVLDGVGTPEGYQLKVRWITKQGMDLGAIDTIYIKAVDLNNWYELLI